MKFNEVLKKRESTRKFKSEKVSDKTIKHILELAQLAPSAGNVQAYKIKIVKGGAGIKRLKEASFTSQGLKQEWISNAPVALIVCADIKESEKRFGERGKNFYALQDATIFTSYVQLVVTSLGLASGWVGNFDEENLKNLINLSKDLKIIAIIPFGYPVGETHPRIRKKLADVIIK